MKNYLVSIDFTSVEICVKATNVTEAKRKALKKLSKKNPVKLIHRSYPSNKRNIYVDEG